MAEYLEARLHMVSDVHAELQRLSPRFPALAGLLEDWPLNPVRELSLATKAGVAAAIKARQVPGQHPNEDRGEIATVLYAAERRDSGEIFEIITDDGFGKQLARDRRFKLLTTPSLTVQMVRDGALPHADGKRVWRQCVSRSGWKDFDRALARERTRV
jgi:hypothetical protein